MSAVKQAAPNLAKFHDVKGRINDLYNSCGHKIRKRHTVWATALIFSEMQWMVTECKRLAGGGKKFSGDEERYARIVAFVKRVCVEQAAAIKGGQIIKISAEIFGAYRFLVRTLEEIVTYLVDDDVAAGITQDKLSDENSDRVTLDLTEGLGDPDDSDDDDDGTDVEKGPMDAERPRGTKAPEKERMPEQPPVIGLSGSDDGDLPGGPSDGETLG